MTGLQSGFLTMRARARRWLAPALLALALLGGAMAQGNAPSPATQGETRAIRVLQSVFLDDSAQLDFDAARNQAFQAFNPLSRFDLANKVAWLRLHVERPDHADSASPPGAGALFVHLIPPQLDDVTLYSPSSQAPGSWDQRKLDSSELLGSIRLGEPAQSSDYYFRVIASNEVALTAFVGESDEISKYQRDLDLFATSITTLMFIVLAFMLWRTLRHFSWMSLLISALVPTVLMRYWFGLGYAHTVLGIPLSVGIMLIGPVSIAYIGWTGGIYVILVTTLFRNQQWLRWFWIWPVFQACLLMYAFVDSSTASRLSSVFWRVMPVGMAIALVIAAVREPSALRPWSSKVAFGLLLTAGALTLAISLQSGGISGSTGAELTSSLFMSNMLVRTSHLVLIVAMANWIFETLQANRLLKVTSELQASKESLELESKRLQRQRKFTAMLAHELKNPLTVSHMALSGIESRLGDDGPLMERAASIKQSLQDINAIVERCTEIDGFEQGELPMNTGTFTLNHFMRLIKEANPNERIYVLARGIHEDALLTTDIQYLKIIVNNLLANALKYSPPDSLVELAVRSVMDEGDRRTLELCVSNEVGPAGTPAPDRAFERYYRAEGARSQSGAGLGLWLSQALAHALGSEVAMRTVGAKISFSLTLPYE
jgi:signal transduction histidine kinase